MVIVVVGACPPTIPPLGGEAVARLVAKIIAPAASKVRWIFIVCPLRFQAF